MPDLLDMIDAVGRFVWRVPSPAKLQSWELEQILDLHTRRGHNPWVADAVMAELQRRDDIEAAVRRVAERQQRARARRKAVMTDYQVEVEAAYLAADDACRGQLVNREGRAKGIDGRWLFSGPAAYAMRYASYELREWWETHPRMTFAEWSAGQRQPRPDYV